MNEPYQTTGGRYSRDRTGISTFSVPWFVDAADFASLANFEPPDPPLGLPIVNRSAEQETDGTWKLMITYEGVAIGDQLVDETFDLDYSSAEDPIETFSQILALRAKYKGALDDQNHVIWAPQIADKSGNKVRNPMYGVETYLNPGAIWRRTRALRDFDATALSALGKIDEPQGGVANKNYQANPPQIQDGRNWLKRALKATWRGNIWQFSEEWMLSGPGGWVPDIYAQHP